MRLVILALLVAYGVGVWKFWSGYNRTNFSPSLPSRLALSMFWPVLFAVNPAYRKNFQKALKGR
jgi:hypothetical protein